MTIMVVTNAFVDVSAVESVAVVAIVAFADETSEIICAGCPCVTWVEIAFVQVVTGVAQACKSRFAFTLVTSDVVFAVGIWTGIISGLVAFVDVVTFEAVSAVSGVAIAFVVDCRRH